MQKNDRHSAQILSFASEGARVRARRVRATPIFIFVEANPEDVFSSNILIRLPVIFATPDNLGIFLEFCKTTYQELPAMDRWQGALYGDISTLVSNRLLTSAGFAKALKSWFPMLEVKVVTLSENRVRQKRLEFLAFLKDQESSNA